MLLTIYLGIVTSIGPGTWQVPIFDEKELRAPEMLSIQKHFVVVVQSLSLSDSLWPYGLQHTRLPCPSPLPELAQTLPFSQWCHPAISSSAVPFSSCLQSCPASRSFPVNQLFTLGGHRIGASASASVLPVNIHGWFPLGLTGLITLLSKGLSRTFSNTSLKTSVLQCSAVFIVQLPHLYITTRKTIALTIQTFVGQVISLLFNIHYLDYHGGLVSLEVG